MSSNSSEKKDETTRIASRIRYKINKCTFIESMFDLLKGMYFCKVIIIAQNLVFVEYDMYINCISNVTIKTGYYLAFSLIAKAIIHGLI